MRNIEVKRRQSLFDIAIQECGNAAAAITIAIANNISISTTPQGVVLIPDAVVVNRPILQRIIGANPASDITGAEMGGIGATGIEIDFCVANNFEINIKENGTNDR